MTKQQIHPVNCIYDKDGYKMRAAAVCVKDDSESEVLLVSSPTRPNSWIIPAGKVEVNEDCGTCALREAMEEGGACGKLGRFLGTYDNQDLKKRTCAFVLYVDRLLDDFLERDKRKRQWFPINDAKNILLGYKSQNCDYLNALQTSSAHNLCQYPFERNLDRIHESCVTKVCCQKSGSKPLHIIATDQLLFFTTKNNGTVT